MELKPMGIGELLDHTFTLFRRAWKPLLLLGLISILPSFIVTLLLNTLVTVNQGSLLQNLVITAVEQAGNGNLAILISAISVYLLLILLLLFLSPLWVGAFIAAAHQVVLGETPTIGSAFRASLSRYFALLGTNILLGLLYIIAFPILVICGLVILSPFTLLGGYLTLWTFFGFCSQVIIIERVSGGPAAMRRSWNLAKSRFWPILGTKLLFTIMLSVVGGILGLFLQTPAGLLQSFVLQNEIGALLVSITQNLPTIFAAPLSALALTMIYYDARIRSEGLDLQMQLQSQSPFPQ